MRIGIDIDDTITNTWEYFIPEFSKIFNIPESVLKQSNPYYYSLKNIITADEYFKIINPVYDKYSKNVPIKNNVKEVIDKLYELGHTITFITARGKGHSNPQETTLKYLQKHQIKYDNIIFTEQKDEICQKEHIDLFIDDSIKHCESVSKTGIEVIMFKTNYNKDYPKFTKFDNWQDIYEYIKSR